MKEWKDTREREKELGEALETSSSFDLCSGVFTDSSVRRILSFRRICGLQATSYNYNFKNIKYK